MKTKAFGNIVAAAIMLFVLSACQQQTVQNAPDNNASDQINQTRALRELMQSDPHRPLYHFVAPEGTAYPFDPNGGIYWNGKYHLGFIYQNLERGS